MGVPGNGVMMATESWSGLIFAMPSSSDTLCPPCRRLAAT
jgi:hypothetical protein